MMRKGNYNRQTTNVPVNVGDELEVKIEAVGAKGDGIAKKNGFVLFVPNTQAGQNVKVRITKVLRNLGFAEVVGEGSGKSEDSESSDSQDSDSEEESEEAEEDFSSEDDSEDFGDESQEE